MRKFVLLKIICIIFFSLTGNFFKFCTPGTFPGYSDIVDVNMLTVKSY